VIAGAAVVFAGLALRKYWGKPDDKFSRIWLFFTVGMIFWFLGELGWEYLDKYKYFDVRHYPACAQYMGAFPLDEAKAFGMGIWASMSRGFFMLLFFIFLTALTTFSSGFTVTSGLDISLFTLTEDGFMFFATTFLIKSTTYVFSTRKSG
jgi:hypothetical protein